MEMFRLNFSIGARVTTGTDFMKRFQCPQCHNELYFDSQLCERCGARTGYDPVAFGFVTLSKDASGRLKADRGPSSQYICRNSEHDACNWLANDGDDFCLSCRHNRTIPDLSITGNLQNWKKLEAAKRYMMYSMLRWRLPMATRAQDPKSGLVFDTLADTTNPDGSVTRVLTGHDEGIITLNLAEADDAIREKTRTQMHEPYRTLLGHFRHEIGHYSWDRLVRDAGQQAAFRDVFGDERIDYMDALKRNYEQGPPEGWQGTYISSYASIHPWEDFAETWAHYTHIVDSLETAQAYGMTLCVTGDDVVDGSTSPNSYEARDIEAILGSWMPLTLAMNSLNRSMGQRDFYPFVIGPPVAKKLEFVHKLIHGQIGHGQIGR